MTERVVRVRECMGTVMSVHVLGPGAVAEPVESAIERALDSLAGADARFSPYRESSAVRRIARGELRIDEAGADVAEVANACRAAELATGGRFSAWRDGAFDPTGYVKGWAAERAFTTELLPLLERPGVEAVGLNAGGDLRVATSPDRDRPWRLGVADPVHPGRTIATIELRDGAVATSGTAERGTHIVDPRDGRPAIAVRSATVVADDLALADVWATAAVVAGPEDLGWIGAPGIRSGLLIAEDGRTRRWASGVELVEAGEGVLPAA